GDLFSVDQAIIHYGGFPPASSGDRIRKVSPDGIISTIAGGGTVSGGAADGGAGTNALLYYPIGAAVDGAGNLYFSESSDGDGESYNRIRKISPDGILTTVAGHGHYGDAGDGGPATDAELLGPGNLAADSKGNLFFVDFGGQRIRKVSPDGVITTVFDNNASASPSCSCWLAGLASDPEGSLIF